MKIIPFITRTIPTSFKANNLSEKNKPNNSSKEKISEFKKYQINENKLETSKDTFTLQNSTAKNTTPETNNSYLLYSRLFLY